MATKSQKTTQELLSEQLFIPEISLNKRLLGLIKEWGGVATVLIAILYTFPFDAASRFISWRDHDISEARQILSEIAALYADQTSSVEKLKDGYTKSFLQNTYAIRIYNKLYQNKDLIRRASGDLVYSELYALGSFLTLANIQDEGFFYYNLALNKAAKKKNYLYTVN
jgi:hypothetical protein